MLTNSPGLGFLQDAPQGPSREAPNLTASTGVAPNKFLAKIASDWKKPNGRFVIQPYEVQSFLLYHRVFAVGSGPNSNAGGNLACNYVLNIEPATRLRRRPPNPSSYHPARICEETRSPVHPAKITDGRSLKHY